MKSVLGSKGSIVVYNESFEKGIIKNLAEFIPSSKKWANSVLERVVDLIVPFRKFYYYNPSQKGSASLKATLPAITGEDHYKKLNISDGGDASAVFFNMTFKDELDEKEIEKIRVDLEKYCGLDTEAMVWIVEKLERLAK